jgi:hypothetical protein
MLIQQFLSAKKSIQAAPANSVSKDVSWLWRAAYNCAVQGCSEWENAEEKISELFDISRELLEVYCEGTPIDVETDLYVHIVDTSFASISGKGMTK